MAGLAMGQTSRFDSLITSGVRQIYNIEFEDAHNTFAVVKQEFPGHPAGIFFDTMTFWWKIMIDLDNEEYDDEFYDRIDNVIDFCDDILDNDPENVDAIFFKGGSLGFRGKLLSLRNDFFDAALDGKEALPLVYEAYELDSTNVDVQLGFGIYNYFAAVLPEKYPFIKPFMIFFPSGDKLKGIKQLENVAYNGKYAKIEARYFLMSSYYLYENNSNAALKYAKMLNEDFPDNPTFQRYYGRIYVRKNNYRTAAGIFRDILAKCNEEKRGYSPKVKREATYYIAMDYKLKNQPDSAKIFFDESLEISRRIDEDEESGFWINTVLYLGQVNDQLGNREKAIEYYNEVLDLRERNDSHKIAERYLLKPYKR
ncbi:tetratricopeptide repeat protein [Bacteroidota bacterium]